MADSKGGQNRRSGSSRGGTGRGGTGRGAGRGGAGSDRRQPGKADGRSGGGEGRSSGGARSGRDRDTERTGRGDGSQRRSGEGRRSAEGGRRRGAPSSGGDSRGAGRGERRGDITLTAGGDLPRWVREEVTRSTPKDRREPALIELTAGLAAYADERYQQAASALRKAKAMSPRAATVREVLGLSAYRFEAWEEALRELRTFRRIAGDTSHMPVEMDCLRALGRDPDIDKVWELFGELGGSSETEDEIRVVYASHLLDRGRVADAWRVIKPGRLVANPSESALRRWAVAARVAAESGDATATSSILDAIRKAEPDIEWLADLERQLES